MQTRVCRLYGKQDLRLETDEVALPGSGEVLVKVGRGGICGSDIHYFLDGGIGTVRVSEPIILGHEFAGTIVALGEDVAGLHTGDKVGINPSQPCGRCSYCQKGESQHCTEMRFIGSAMRVPHEQGGFRELLVVKAKQCIKGAGATTVAELACAEPLAVCLHAAKIVGDLAGKKVLVNGAGPIGALCVAVARYRGAKEIVVMDLFDKTLAVALEMGADKAINIVSTPGAIADYSQDKGYFDVIFECSAAQAAIENIFQVVRPRGTIVQVGVAGMTSYPMNMLVGKEVKWIGSHRFHDEYGEAVSLMSQQKINVRPIITDVFPVTDLHKAIQAATDRSMSVKVQISFEEETVLHSRYYGCQ